MSKLFWNAEEVKHELFNDGFLNGFYRYFGVPCVLVSDGFTGGLLERGLGKMRLGGRSARVA